VEELQLRVTELENGQRINAQTTARHAEALDAIGKALNDDHDEENEEGAMLQ
jgi:hypothetical protein